MKFPHYIWLSILMIAACSRDTKRKGQNDVQSQAEKNASTTNASSFPFLQTDLNKKNITTNGNYYLLIKYSDSTIKIAWGNDTVNRIYEVPLDFVFAEKLHIQYDSKEYLILRYGVGSDAWVTNVFPINYNEPVRTFDNGLYFDDSSMLLVAQKMGDTVFAVHNLKTGKDQFIIDKESHCEAVYNVYCIDSISIRNRVLYYRWITPNMFANPKEQAMKKIKLLI